MAVSNLDLADIRARNSRLAGDGANEIARADAIALPDAHEEACEPSF